MSGCGDDSVGPLVLKELKCLQVIRMRNRWIQRVYILKEEIIGFVQK